MVCSNVILLWYKITCLGFCNKRFCNKKGYLSQTLYNSPVYYYLTISKCMTISAYYSLLSAVFITEVGDPNQISTRHQTEIKSDVAEGKKIFVNDPKFKHLYILILYHHHHLTFSPLSPAMPVIPLNP